MTVKLHIPLFIIQYILTFQLASPSDLVLHDGCTSGSIHQASEIFNGPGRGLQCVANAVCALLHSAKTDPATWRVYDIDEILHKGYMLYQQNGKTNWLLPSDIPEYITIDKTNYEVNEMQS